MIKIFSAVLAAFLFVSCSGKNPISEDKFVEIYIDLVIAQDTSAAVGSSFEGIKQNIFARYKVNEKEYEETLAYYNEDSERWVQFFDKAILKLETKRRQEAKL